MADLNSKIILVENINLDRNYVNVLSYSQSQMLSLCETNAIATSNKYSFIRARENIVATNFSYSQCLRANYIAFQNPDYSNKWFFAFVDDVIYKGEENTEIKFTIDSWSTWFSNWTKKNCYVIRHHVNDDVIGRYTIPENLDIGDVYEYDSEEDMSYTEYRIAVLTSFNPAEQNNALKQFSGITVYNRQIFGKWIFLFGSYADLMYFIHDCNLQGHTADIQDMWYVPNALINDSDLIQITGSVEYGEQTRTYSFWSLPYTNSVPTFNTEITKVHSYSDYTPKNNKCFVYPYNYLLVTNNNGNCNIYKYEDFSTNTCVFRNEGVISIGNSIQTVPLNYKNMSVCADEAIPLSKYPTIAWSSDAFTNWMTQNAVNMQTSFLTTVLSLSLSALGMVAGGAGAEAEASAGSQMLNFGTSGISSIAGTMASWIGGMNYASMLPNTQKGNNNGDINFQGGYNTFVFRNMRVKLENLKIIDDYFSRYGYKIVRLTSPNITGRTNWNYVEIGSSEEIGYGDVPTKYMEEINNACRRGVTIWHNHANIGNYSLSNTVVT